jgi:predicted  nucleic acid-binding Zn-ribbon protein
LLEQLKYLIELQSLENKKNWLIRTREETPQRISGLEKEFAHFQGEYLVKKSEYDNALKMRKSLERDLVDLEDKMARSKQRTNEVKTNKEYRALLKEIEEQKRETSKKEDRLLEIMEVIDSMKEEVEKLAGEVEERSRQVEKDKETLSAQSEQVGARIARLEQLQQEVFTKLDPELLKRCRSLLEIGGKIAVAPVQNGVCQICHMSIPPQKFIELQRDQSILHCPNCHRFIYWSEHEMYGVIEEQLKEL